MPLLTISPGKATRVAARAPPRHDARPPRAHARAADFARPRSLADDLLIDCLLPRHVSTLFFDAGFDGFTHAVTLDDMIGWSPSFMGLSLSGRRNKTRREQK